MAAVRACVATALSRPNAYQHFRWHECDLETSRNRLLTLNSRSSSAGCCFEGQMLMYGGTLNGNAGPLLGDLLTLSLDKINYLLTIKLAK